MATTAGCVRRTRSIISRDDPDRIALSIATVPADRDPIPPQIARQLRSNLETAGVSTSLEMLSAEEFQREILVNHSFDIAIGRYPADPDPDFLYSALHSSFGPESGWQNPFGYANMNLNELLEKQLTACKRIARQQIDSW